MQNNLLARCFTTSVFALIQFQLVPRVNNIFKLKWFIVKPAINLRKTRQRSFALLSIFLRFMCESLCSTFFYEFISMNAFQTALELKKTYRYEKILAETLHIKITPIYLRWNFHLETAQCLMEGRKERLCKNWACLMQINVEEKPKENLWKWNFWKEENGIPLETKYFSCLKIPFSVSKLSLH